MDSITTSMSTKIQKLLEKWHQGALRTVSVLKELGYSQSLINHYRKSGWINSVAVGLVIRAGYTPSIFSAIATLQNDLKLDVRIDGITALELQGGAHYIRRGKIPFMYLEIQKHYANRHLLVDLIVWD